jgi:hypothetical protein
MGNQLDSSNLTLEGQNSMYSQICFATLRALYSMQFGLNNTKTGKDKVISHQKVNLLLRK